MHGRDVDGFAFVFLYVRHFRSKGEPTAHDSEFPVCTTQFHARSGACIYHRLRHHRVVNRLPFRSASFGEKEKDGLPFRRSHKDICGVRKKRNKGSRRSSYFPAIKKLHKPATHMNTMYTRCFVRLPWYCWVRAAYVLLFIDNTPLVPHVGVDVCLGQLLTGQKHRKVGGRNRRKDATSHDQVLPYPAGRHRSKNYERRDLFEAMLFSSAGTSSMGLLCPPTSGRRHEDFLNPHGHRLSPVHGNNYSVYGSDSRAAVERKTCCGYLDQRAVLWHTGRWCAGGYHFLQTKRV